MKESDGGGLEKGIEPARLGGGGGGDSMDTCVAEYSLNASFTPK